MQRAHAEDRRFLVAALSVFLGALGQLAVTVTIARTFGASVETDLYFLAVIYAFAILGVFQGMAYWAIVSSFRDVGEREVRGASEAISAHFTVGMVVAGIATAFFAALAPYLAPAIAWSFTSTSQDLGAQLALELTPLIFVGALLWIAFGIYLAYRSFLWVLLVPVAIAVVMILSVLGLTPVLHVHALAAAILGGTALPLLFLVDLLIRRGVQLKWKLELYPTLRRTLNLGLPLIPVLVVLYLVEMTDRMLASGFFPGMVSSIVYAERFWQLPLALAALALIAWARPSWSPHAWEERREEVSRQLLGILRVVLVLSVIVVIVMIIFARPIVTFLLSGGAFGGLPTIWTTQALIFYLPGVPGALVCLSLLPFFVAAEQTRILAILSGVFFVLKLFLDVLLIQEIGFAGIPLATSLSFTILAIAMWRLYGRLAPPERTA